MKPMPDADEHRRLGKVETEKALRLPAGPAKEDRLKKARTQIQCAFEGLRESNLRAPE